MTPLDALRDEPHRFALFAALRMLEQLHGDAPRFGVSRRLRDDPVRFAQLPSLTFAPADVAGYDESRGSRPVLEQFGFGVFGPNGALPLHLTEFAYQRQRQQDDPAVTAFVNLFQHRMIALFYRAWANADPAACRDRPASDAFDLYVGALLGLGARSSRERDAVLDEAKLSRVALFGMKSRPADGLETVLEGYFSLPFAVEQYCGAWLEIPDAARTRLGGGRATAALGWSATLGAASWQVQHRFEIVAGPMSLAEFLQFMPGQPTLEELRALVRLYTNDEWSWQLRLLVAERDVPAARLDGATQLGWTSWLGGRRDEASDVVLQGDALNARAAA
jgi:type VI secretion system protein ImpH